MIILYLLISVILGAILDTVFSKIRLKNLLSLIFALFYIYPILPIPFYNPFADFYLDDFSVSIFNIDFGMKAYELLLNNSIYYKIIFIILGIYIFAKCIINCRKSKILDRKDEDDFTSLYSTLIALFFISHTYFGSGVFWVISMILWRICIGLLVVAVVSNFIPDDSTDAQEVEDDDELKADVQVDESKPENVVKKKLAKKKASRKRIKKRSNFDDVDNYLVFFRFDFENSKIKIASKEIKESYINLLHHFLSKNEYYSEYAISITLSEYATSLSVSFDEQNTNDVEQSIKNICKLFKLKKKRRIPLLNFFPSSKDKKYVFKMMFIFEYLFFEYLLNFTSKNGVSNENIVEHSELFDLTPEEEAIVNNYINILNDKKADTMEALVSFIDTIEHEYFRKMSNNVQTNIEKSLLYRSLPKYDIAIMGTMSAGKSSFINALLGDDYIPSKNEACTAKVTSIIDNNTIADDKSFGVSLSTKGEYGFSKLSSDVVESWNANADIVGVILETDIRDIAFDLST